MVGLVGLSVKKVLIDETSAIRQLASDGLPTVWIRDTPPVLRPVGRCGSERRVSALRRIGGETHGPSSMVTENWAPLLTGGLSRVYVPVFIVASEEESGCLQAAGGASRGRTNDMKGGPIVTFEAPQLTVNGPHCVVGECNGVKPRE